MGSPFIVTHVETHHIALNSYEMCHYNIIPMYAFFDWTEDVQLPRNIQEI
jgi:hypothetical protein